MAKSQDILLLPSAATSSHARPCSRVSFRDTPTTFQDTPPVFGVFAASFAMSVMSQVHIVTPDPWFKDR